MSSHVRLGPAIDRLLRCPVCGSELDTQICNKFQCTSDTCNALFPAVNGIPILINERHSVFTIDDVIHRRDTFFGAQATWKRVIRSVIPDIGENLKARTNYRRFVAELLEQSERPTVLVLGAGIVGSGMDELLATPTVQFVETDVFLGPRTMLVCDAHDIPFADSAFDGVVVQAVLEHVADPYRCVQEIHRVLKDGGLAYSEIPFMQQVHGGRYDFTRFTHLGHRRLFRQFAEIDSGAVCGPGMALAWSALYFFLSFTANQRLRQVINLASRLLLFPLKYADRLLIDQSAALDAASGTYFIGRKAGETLADRDLIMMYRGANLL